MTTTRVALERLHGRRDGGAMKPLKELLLLSTELLLLAALPILIVALLILPSRIVRRAYDWIDGVAQ